MPNANIQVRSNLRLVFRERGKIVRRLEGHNIFVGVGREWLAGLICYASYAGAVGTPERNDRIQYVGFGIGGDRQSALSIVNAVPLSVDYPGTNLQNDLDVNTSQLERPVRVSWTTSAPTQPPTYDAGDQWFKQVAPVTGLTGHPTARETRFVAMLGENDINGILSDYPVVPLSEIGLYTSAIDPHRPSNLLYPANVAVAYDTFDSAPKSNSFTLEVDWVLRF